MAKDKKIVIGLEEEWLILINWFKNSPFETFLYEPVGYCADQTSPAYCLRSFQLLKSKESGIHKNDKKKAKMSIRWLIQTDNICSPQALSNSGG